MPEVGGSPKKEGGVVKKKEKRRLYCCFITCSLLVVAVMMMKGDQSVAGKRQSREATEEAEGLRVQDILELELSLISEDPPQLESEPLICSSLRSTEAIKSFYSKHWNKSSSSYPVPKRCTGSNNNYLPIRERHIKKNAQSPLLRSTTLRASADKPYLKISEDEAIQLIDKLRSTGVIDQLYFDHTAKIMYCAVPKAGCTGIKAWMLSAASLYKGGTVHNRQLYKGPRIQHSQFMSNNQFIKILTEGEYFKFTVVRNPFTRVFASYLERFANCSKKRAFNECDMWRRRLTGGRCKISDNSSYVDMLKVLKDCPFRSVDFANAHWIPSVSTCSLTDLPFDLISRLESSSDMELINDITGFKKLRSTSVAKGHSTRSQSKLQNHYDSEAINLLKTLYNDDIELLGYKPPPGIKKEK